MEVSFGGAAVVEVSFGGATVVEVRFGGATVVEVSFRGATVVEVSFGGAAIEISHVISFTRLRRQFSCCISVATTTTTTTTTIYVKSIIIIVLAAVTRVLQRHAALVLPYLSVQKPPDVVEGVRGAAHVPLCQPRLVDGAHLQHGQHFIVIYRPNRL